MHENQKCETQNPRSVIRKTRFKHAIQIGYSAQQMIRLPYNPDNLKKTIAKKPRQKLAILHLYHHSVDVIFHRT